MTNTHIAALIVAAGSGQRAGGDRPKQWQTVAGRPVIDWTLRAFQQHPQISTVAVVLHREAMDTPIGIEPDLRIIGGADRAGSVKAGLKGLQGTGANAVLIHDVARPCVTASLISSVIAALETHPAAAPALPVTDALWRGKDGYVIGTQPRAGLYRAQTPQGFDLNAITQAHAAHPGGAADDVEVARAAGLEVAIVQGDEDNLKITLPQDFERAERILERT